MEHYENIEALLHHVDVSRCPDEMVTLSEDSRSEANYIRGNVAKNWKNALMTTALDYWPVIVELTIPSTNLVNYLCTAFEILEFVDDLITKSDLPVSKATEGILIHCFQSFQSFAFTTYEAITRKIKNFTVINIYFNNNNNKKLYGLIGCQWSGNI